jgi:hypothetical protein
MGENNGDKFRFGFNIANIGPPITFIDEAQADPAPTNMRLGVFANLHEDEFTRVNMMMDMQKLLVAKYPSMDWNDDRKIGDGPGGNSFNNSAGQNEGQYADPWYKAWATAWPALLLKLFPPGPSPILRSSFQSIEGYLATNNFCISIIILTLVNSSSCKLAKTPSLILVGAGSA